MAWTNCAGIGGRPELGRRKSTNIDLVEPFKDTLDVVGTSDGQQQVLGQMGLLMGLSSPPSSG